MLRDDERRRRLNWIEQRIRELEGAIELEERKWPSGIPREYMATVEGYRDTVRVLRIERQDLERPDLTPEQLKEYADRAWDIASRIEVDVVPALRRETAAMQQNAQRLEANMERLEQRLDGLQDHLDEGLATVRADVREMIREGATSQRDAMRLIYALLTLVVAGELALGIAVFWLVQHGG